MSGNEKLQQIVDRVAERSRLAEDERAALPPLDADDAAELARGLHREVNRLGRARDRAALDSGTKIACRRGCHACCFPAVMVFRPEAVSVARWLELPDNRAARESFLAAYPAWREALAEPIDQMIAHHAAGELDAAQELYNQIPKRRVVCAFNRDGDCTIYPARPIACRYFVAVDTADHCDPDRPHGRGPTLFAYKPLEELVDRGRAILRAAHDQMEAGEPRPLCDAVYELLTEPAPSGS